MNQTSALTLDQGLSCVATAPTRVDLAGGTLDIWPLAPILQEKFGLWNSPIKTVNVAIDLRATAQVSLSPRKTLQWRFTDANQKLDEAGDTLSSPHAERFVLQRAVTRHFASTLESLGLAHIVMTTQAEAPRSSGLGGSSSLVVAMLAAMDALLAPRLGYSMEKRLLCLSAQNLEAGVLGGLAGNQDHFAAAFGGVQEVTHSANGTFQSHIDCDGDALMDHLVLAWSGQQHFSAFNNWLILERALTGDEELLAKCADIARIAHDLPSILTKGAWVQMAQMMTKEWSIRRTLADGITTPLLDAMYTKAIKAGAIGGKVCGAGGGGVLVMALPDPGAREQVMEAIEREGGMILRTRYSPTGTRITSCPVTAAHSESSSHWEVPKFVHASV